MELRADLERRGHTLTTAGDTETIVHLYEEYGTRFVEHLRGMFAIAIWDGRTGRLVLARDRLGKKPLYWRLAAGRLTYGSELKSIMADPDLERVVDREALDLYLQHQYVPSPWTILEGVNKLPPASVLTWDGGEPHIERYWSPSYEPKDTRPHEELVDEGLSLIREAVRLRLRSDVPVGVFLSGGMDSSVVTALMAEQSVEPVRTFSIGFEDQSYDELGYARAVAERYGTVHSEEIVSLDAIELLPHLAEHYDEPFADSSAVPTFRVAQLAARQLKVVLTGDGGDETFGGYSRYRVNGIFGTLDMVPTPLLVAAARAGRVVTRPLGPQSRTQKRLRIAEGLFGHTPDERYVAQMTSIASDDRHRLLRDRNGTAPYLLDVLRAGPSDPIDRLLRADLLTYLPEDLLVKMDRATMANSLEARSPLLDHELVEFVARLPVENKINGKTTKVLLRAIAKRLMPAAHIDRPEDGLRRPDRRMVPERPRRPLRGGRPRPGLGDAGPPRPGACGRDAAAASVGRGGLCRPAVVDPDVRDVGAALARRSVTPRLTVAHSAACPDPPGWPHPHRLSHAGPRRRRGRAPDAHPGADTAQVVIRGPIPPAVGTRRPGR